MPYTSRLVSDPTQRFAAASPFTRTQISSHIPSLDGIRAIAIIIVFAAHSRLIPFSPGGFGVSIFFFLSGYLITTLLRREFFQTAHIAMKRFYRRRALRILPPMYISLLVGWLIAKEGRLIEHGNFFGLLAATFYLYNYTALLHLPAIVPLGMSLLWSLMVEEHFYLVFPWVYRSFLRKHLSRDVQTRLLLSLCVVVLLWRCCLVWIFHTSLHAPPIWTYLASDARFDGILFGCLLAIRNNPACGDISRVLDRYKVSFAIAGLVLLFISLVVPEPHFRETLRYTIQGVGLYFVFFYCLSSPQSRPVLCLEWKPIRWLGWVSYSVYLIHMLLLDLGWHFFPQARTRVSFVVIAVSLLYAWLMRVAVEEPLRKRRAMVGSVRSSSSIVALPS